MGNACLWSRSNRCGYFVLVESFLASSGVLVEQREIAVDRRGLVCRQKQEGIRGKVPRCFRLIYFSLCIHVSAFCFDRNFTCHDVVVPLPLAVGIWLIPRYSLRRSRRYVYRAAAFMGLAVVAYVIVYGFGPRIREKPHRVNYPGQMIASEVESAWASAYSKELDYVVADEWLGGIVNHYGRDGASVMIRGMLSRSAYLDDESVRESGAVVIWLKARDARDENMISLERLFRICWFVSLIW